MPGSLALIPPHQRQPVLRRRLSQQNYLRQLRRFSRRHARRRPFRHRQLPARYLREQLRLLCSRHFPPDPASDIELRTAMGLFRRDRCAPEISSASSLLTEANCYTLAAAETHRTSCIPATTIISVHAPASHGMSPGKAILSSTPDGDCSTTRSRRISSPDNCPTTPLIRDCLQQYSVLVFSSCNNPTWRPSLRSSIFLCIGRFHCQPETAHALYSELQPGH